MNYFPQDSSSNADAPFWSDTQVGTIGPKAFLYVDDTTILDTVILEDAKLHISVHPTVEELSRLEVEDTLIWMLRPEELT